MTWQHCQRTNPSSRALPEQSTGSGRCWPRRCCAREYPSGRFNPPHGGPTLYDKQIKLLETFADQAVIAIENVRLFKELEARTRELARSVGELKALGEVGQAVSSTLDLQTVLSTIVGHAVQLSRDRRRCYLRVR